MFFGMKKHTTYFLLYFLYEKTTSHIHTVILNTDVCQHLPMVNGQR